MRQIGIHLDAPCRRLGVGQREGHLLSYLRSYAPCPISELHRVFGTKRSTLTSMFDRMEQRGWLRRRQRPHDRRSYLVELTSAGEQLAAEVQVLVDDLENELGRRVDAQALDGFRAVMQAIDEVTRVEVRTTDDPRARRGGQPPADDAPNPEAT